ncbi:alpha/beta fold hydrolase [Pseudonocardia sp.]|uniref:alpha/beta fold hydrolase n=2 Tax=Pseudonocardia sp. TaxID=60912 RepID=UPI003D0A0634
MTVLFLHPVGLDRDAARFLDLGADGGDVHAVTFPGHGDRRRARPGLTLADMADEIAGHARGPFDVVGASLGGMVAMHLALDHPGMVRSLVLACTTPDGAPDVMEARAAATEEHGSAGMLDDTMTRWFTADGLASGAPYLDHARERLLAMDPGALADTWRAIGAHHVLDRLGDITVPATCIAGRVDASTPLEAMSDLASRLPAARLVELDAPHMAFMENADEFAAAVRAHLEWVEGDDR